MNFVCFLNGNKNKKIPDMRVLQLNQEKLCGL